MTTTIQIEGMDELIEAVGGGGGSGAVVPVPTLADDCKVLMATESIDSGMQLEWSDDILDKRIPDASPAARGRVLTVENNGTLGWEMPSSGGREVPDATSQTAGKILKTTGGGTPTSYMWDTDRVPSALPIDAGKVLTVNADGDGAWMTPRTVPDTTGVTNGYVLTNDNGTPAWAASQGGGGSDISFIGATVNASDWCSDGAGSYYVDVTDFYAVLDLQVASIVSLTIFSYSNDTITFVQPTKIEVDFKSGAALIFISSADHALISGATAYLKLLYKFAS